jgi:hypothetical protein
MQGNPRKQELASQKMSLNKDVAVLLVERSVRVEKSEERWKFALPIKEFLIELENHGIVWRFDGESYKATM